LNGRHSDGCLFFGTLGLTRARFGAGTTSSGGDVSDKKIPNTPDYTASLGLELGQPVGKLDRLYGRAEVVLYGAFKYDDFNTAGQDAYSVTNFRFGARARRVFVESWIKNAFDTNYVPVAFAYGQLAPSGFVGESGRPRTFGLTLGVTF
jgi:iron complex outermembrane receptor protein